MVRAATIGRTYNFSRRLDDEYLASRSRSASLSRLRREIKTRALGFRENDV